MGVGRWVKTKLYTLFINVVKTHFLLPTLTNVVYSFDTTNGTYIVMNGYSVQMLFKSELIIFFNVL